MRQQGLLLTVSLIFLFFLMPVVHAGNGNGNNGNGNGNGGPRPTPGLDAPMLSALASTGYFGAQWLKARRLIGK